MATKPTPKPDKERWYWPKKDPGFCISCGCECHWRPDRGGRPFLLCQTCGVRVFPRGKMGVIGLEILQQLMSKWGVSNFRELVHEKMKQVGRKSGPA